MSDLAVSSEEVLSLLAQTPARIAELTAGLQPEPLRTAPSPSEWSANEVLAHLRACADMWGGAMLTILREDHPTIRAINPRTWIKKTDYLTQDFQTSLRAFTRQRAELIAVLNGITAED